MPLKIQRLKTRGNGKAANKKNYKLWRPEVKEIMRGSIDVISIQINESFDNVITKMLDAGYSRYPVYEESLDDIKGIILHKRPYACYDAV